MVKKKYSSIAYYFVREGVAQDEWQVTYISTHNKFADIMTKSLIGEKRVRFTGMILHHITWFFE